MKFTNKDFILPFLIQELFDRAVISCKETSDSHVWELTMTTMQGTELLWFEFSDEAEQFSENFYGSQLSAKMALDRYIKECL